MPVFKLERDDAGEFTIRGHKSGVRLHTIVKDEGKAGVNIVAFCGDIHWAERIRSLLEEHYR